MEATMERPPKCYDMATLLAVHMSTSNFNTKMKAQTYWLSVPVAAAILMNAMKEFAVGKVAMGR